MYFRQNFGDLSILIIVQNYLDYERFTTMKLQFSNRFGITNLQILSVLWDI